jgi:hypothetical protein
MVPNRPPLARETTTRAHLASARLPDDMRSMTLRRPPTRSLRPLGGWLYEPLWPVGTPALSGSGTRRTRAPYSPAS